MSKLSGRIFFAPGHAVRRSAANGYVSWARDSIGRVKKQMVGLMAEQGLAYGERNKTYNSRLAQELGSWADTQNNGNELHQQLYRAYFVDNKNISDPEVLVTLVEATSLDSDEAREVLAARTFSVRVDEDWSRAHQYGVTGVPTLLARDSVLLVVSPMSCSRVFRII